MVNLATTGLLALACIAGGAITGAVAMAEPITVEYYMEALCPFCANFTMNQLQPLFNNKLINFVQLDLIPYGNARTNPNTGEVECQHGALECQLNKLLSCAIAINPLQDDWFPFFSCMEAAALKGIKPAQVMAVAHSCAVHAGIVTTKLMECFTGQLGTVLQKLAAERTASLKPAHKYVPWVVVNGIPLMDDDENIMRYICVAYKGRDRPAVCLDIPSVSSLEISSPAEAPAGQQRRYKRCRLGDPHDLLQRAEFV